mgnify:FL=1
MKVVLLDNGHGEDTKGKRSPDGSLLEYAYTREIVNMCAKELELSGVKVIKLAPEKQDISLGERCRRAKLYCNQYGTENVILVSIHCNAAGSGQWLNARGWEVYTTPGATKADKLATELAKVAESTLVGMKIRKDLSDGDPDKEAGFYILVHVPCPAVLTENLFQDNKEDVEFLLSEKGKEAITKIHVEGIKNYLSIK